MSEVKLVGGGWRASTLAKKYGITIEEAREAKRTGVINIPDKKTEIDYTESEASDGS